MAVIKEPSSSNCMRNAKKKSRACSTGSTIHLRQIEKSPYLALGTSQKDVLKYEKVAAEFGNVLPVTVGSVGNMYHVLEGQARLLACAKNGLDKVPVVITSVTEEPEQLKLALMLSTIREDAGAISEGAFIDRLITQYGITGRELTRLLGKSRAWISKRQTLVNRLTDAVKDMVTEGVIYARTAEEIGKLPENVQTAFAQSVVRDHLNKTEAAQLVNQYQSKDASPSYKQAIIESPLTVLPSLPEPSPKHMRQGKDMRRECERIAGIAHYTIRLLNEIKSLIASASIPELALAAPHLTMLKNVTTELEILIAGVVVGVSPGKPSDLVSPGKLQGGLAL